MHFNDHRNLAGQHAFLSPSQYHWVNYPLEKLDDRFLKYRSVEMGIKLHDFAKKAIELGIQMPQDGTTVNMYINDAIFYGMKPEQVLYYSDNAFGTCDAISFDERNNTLRIHDLKTGTTPASMMQLFVYDALFCLEYGISPKDITIENRIYQSNAVAMGCPGNDSLQGIMDKIIIFDKRIDEIKRGVVS